MRKSHAHELDPLLLGVLPVERPLLLPLEAPPPPDLLPLPDRNDDDPLDETLELP
jgi:hypothetical protein